MDNFKTFEPTNFPGVKIPYVKISVNQVAEEAIGVISAEVTQEPTLKNNKDITFVVLPSFLPPPDGHPYFAWNVAYERTLQYLPRIVSSARKGEPIPNINLIIAGNPYNELGTVTKDWVKGVAKEGFSQYGQTYADLIKNAEDDLKNRSVILFGPSMGASIASQVPRNLPEVDAKLYLENPAGLYRKLSKRLQAPVGFALEGILTMISSSDGRKGIQDLRKFTQVAAQTLRERGKFEAPGENEKLKYAAAVVDIANLVKGSKLDTETVRSYVYRGIFDPTATDKAFLKDNFAKTVAAVRNVLAQRAPQFMANLLETPQVKGRVRSEGKSIKFPVTSSHAMERLRLDKWKNIISYCRNTPTLST